MSTILKALRRLESEKPPQPDRPLRDDVVAFRPGEPHEARPGRGLRWAGAGALALIVVLGSLWLASAPFEPGRAPQASVPGDTSSPPSRVADLPPPRTPPPSRRPATWQPVPPNPSPALAERPGPAAEAAPTDPLHARPHRLPDPEPLRAFAAPRESEPAPAPSLALPAARQAPPAQAAPAPEARVDSTTWHPDAERRRAVVSAPGRATVTLREGDAIGELVVRSIEPAGVVFLYRGAEVRRGVGD